MGIQKSTYKDFLRAAYLVDQSDIVTLILKTELDDEMQPGFYNKKDILIPMPDGVEIYPESHFNELIDAGEQLDDYLGTQKYIERTIYEWRLVPAWLANLLIDKGETVFKHLGSCWWGIRNLNKTGFFSKKVLKQIYSEIPDL